jgi:hypothetical protein
MNNKKTKNNRGRKPTSSNVHIQPIFRTEPDIEKLGRAVMTYALINSDINVNKTTGEFENNAEK